MYFSSLPVNSTVLSAFPKFLFPVLHETVNPLTVSESRQSCRSAPSSFHSHSPTSYVFYRSLQTFRSETDENAAPSDPPGSSSGLHSAGSAHSESLRRTLLFPGTRKRLLWRTVLQAFQKYSKQEIFCYKNFRNKIKHFSRKIAGISKTQNYEKYDFSVKLLIFFHFSPYLSLIFLKLSHFPYLLTPTRTCHLPGKPFNYSIPQCFFSPSSWRLWWEGMEELCEIASATEELFAFTWECSWIMRETIIIFWEKTRYPMTIILPISSFSKGKKGLLVSREVERSSQSSGPALSVLYWQMFAVSK